jgi:hypothetical protein
MGRRCGESVKREKGQKFSKRAKGQYSGMK